MKKIVFIIIVIWLSQLYALAQNGIEKTERIDSSIIVSKAINRYRIGQFEITPEQTNRAISSLGENDVLQAIGLRPGTAVGLEGSTGFFVRGASTGGNRIELSGAPIYRSSHILGLVSALPPEMISTMDFSAAGFSATSGNFSSSLSRINLKQTIAPKLTGSISIAPFMESFYAEAPLGKTFTARVSARYSPALIIADKVLEKFAKKGDSFDIHDIGGKAYDLMATTVWKPISAISVDALAFFTKDGLNYSFDGGGQKVSSSEKVFKIGASYDIKQFGYLSISSYYTSSKANHIENHYDTNSGILSYGINNKEEELGAKIQYSVILGKLFQFIVGGEFNTKKLAYDTFKNINAEDGTSLSSNGDISLISCFAELSTKVDNIFEISISARPSSYKHGDIKDKGTDFHAKASYSLSSLFEIETSYDKSFQYYHVLEGLPSGWSQNLMIASDDSFPKECLNQYSIGTSGAYSFSDSPWSINYSIGYFNRRMNNLTSFKHVSHVFGLHDNIDNEDIVIGEGYSYGIEFFLETKTDVFEATMAYTHSVAKRKFDDLNYGKEFKFRFDKPHVLNITASYLLNQKKKGKSRIEHRFNAGANLSSGNLMTANKGFYPSLRPGVPVIIPNDPYMLEDMSELNNFRLPSYFRLDAGYSFSKTGEKYGYEISVSIYNILNHHNAYQYYYSDGQWKQLSILPIMPSVRLTAKF